MFYEKVLTIHIPNTLLPGMKLGMNLKTGQSWTLSSWFSEQLPAPGAFRLGMDHSGINQLIIWRREVIYWTSGVWGNGSFQLAPELTTRVDLFESILIQTRRKDTFPILLEILLLFQSGK